MDSTTITQPTKGQIFVYGMREKNPHKDAIIVNTTSRSKESWSRKFSPFFIGPMMVEPFPDKKYEVKYMENAWQYLKVYPGYEKDNEKYLRWATEGFSSNKANRFPMGRGKKPLHSIWKGQRIDYIEARKKIYCPLYAYCVEKYASASFEKLQNMYLSGKKIVLLDFDGYSKWDDLNTVLNNPKRKMGHAFVLAMMLRGERHWEETENQVDNLEEAKIPEPMIQEKKQNQDDILVDEDEKMVPEATAKKSNLDQGGAKSSHGQQSLDKFMFKKKK